LRRRLNVHSPFVASLILGWYRIAVSRAVWYRMQ
jgi:hypothetical protein